MTRQPASSPTLLQALLRLTVLLLGLSSFVTGIALTATSQVKNNVLISFTRDFSQSGGAPDPIRAIQLVDLQRNRVQEILSGFADEPGISPNQRYLTYMREVGANRRCEIRDLHRGIRLVYRSVEVARCRFLWSGDSRTVMLAVNRVDEWNRIRFILLDITRPEQAKEIPQFHGYDWYAAVQPGGDRILIFVQYNLKARWKAYLLDTETGSFTPIPDAGGFYTDDYIFASWINWSLDGRYAAFSSIDGHELRLLLLDVEELNLRLIAQGGLRTYNVDWAPDGTWFIFHSPQQRTELNYFAPWSLNRYTLETESVETIWSDVGYWRQPVWSDDERYIVIRTQMPIYPFEPLSLYLWDTISNTRQTLESDGRHIAYAWSPDGRFLTWTENYGGFYRHYLREVHNESQRILLEAYHSGYDFHWLNDRKLMIVAAAAPGHLIYIIDVSTGELKQSEVFPGMVSWWNILPEKDYLITNASTDRFVGSYLINLNTLEANAVSGHPIPINAGGIWSSDRQLYVFTGGSNHDLYVLNMRCSCVREIPNSIGLQHFTPLWVR
jgi:hypothetical protein